MAPSRRHGLHSNTQIFARLTTDQVEHRFVRDLSKQAVTSWGLFCTQTQRPTGDVFLTQTATLLGALRYAEGLCSEDYQRHP